MGGILIEGFEKSEETVLMAVRIHLFPSRTQKLSSHSVDNTWLETAREDR